MENRSNFFMLKKSRKMENSMLREGWPVLTTFVSFFCIYFIGADRKTHTKKTYKSCETQAEF